jgi:hypothetical protein
MSSTQTPLTSKTPFYHNTAQTVLRAAQGIPEAIPSLPVSAADATTVLTFQENRIVHVAPQTGAKHFVHVYASSPIDTDVFVEVLTNSDLATSGSKNIAASWPKIDAAFTFRLRANQPAPQILLQGFVISAGAALSVYLPEGTALGPAFFGFVVAENSA